jgi:hypothetical protein
MKRHAGAHDITHRRALKLKRGKDAAGPSCDTQCRHDFRKETVTHRPDISITLELIRRKETRKLG